MQSPAAEASHTAVEHVSTFLGALNQAWTLVAGIVLACVYVVRRQTLVEGRVTALEGRMQKSEEDRANLWRQLTTSNEKLATAMTGLTTELREHREQSIEQLAELRVNSQTAARDIAEVKQLVRDHLP